MPPTPLPPTPLPPPIADPHPPTTLPQHTTPPVAGSRFIALVYITIGAALILAGLWLFGFYLLPVILSYRIWSFWWAAPWLVASLLPSLMCLIGAASIQQGAQVWKRKKSPREAPNSFN